MQCARQGMSVICVDRLPVEKAGAHWVNADPLWMFDEAKIEQPKPPERIGQVGAPFHLLAGHGPEGVTIRDHDIVEIDMAMLVARLQSLGRHAGAEYLGEVHVDGIVDGVLKVRDGKDITARWYVDASGVNGTLLKQPAVKQTDLCSAAQQNREVINRDQALEFLGKYGVAEDETLSFSGIAGGYSIVNVRVIGDEVGILTGSIPANGYPTGRKLLEDFVKEQPWIGQEIHGGHRVLPLHRPRNRLATGRVALIGDAGNQMFCAHGSGIGVGLVASRVLAEELAAGNGPRGYAKRWMRKWGWQLAASDLMRRYVEHLTPENVKHMFATGLMSEAVARTALRQRVADALMAAASTAPSAATKAPAMTAKMTPVIAKAVAARALYATYPSSEAALARWSKTADRILGP